MTASEFFKAHRENMQGDVLFEELPFYQWLCQQDPTPEVFVDALFSYYSGHPIKGAFSKSEIASYRLIYEVFWRRNHMLQEKKSWTG